MSQLLYWGDVLTAVSILLFFTAAYATKRISRKTFYLFWVGVLIGAVWEFGFFLVGPEFSETPAFIRTSPWPLPPITQPLLHTFWDGAIFMVGIGLTRKLLRGPHFTRFRISELAVCIAWGQIQEFAVEMIAIHGNLWTYTPVWWNPVLCNMNGGHLTLVPQLIWFIAPIIFYLAAIRVYGNENDG